MHRQFYGYHMKQQYLSIIVLSQVLCVALLGMSFSSCNHKGEQLETCVDSFAQSYFRWQFRKAMNSCDMASYPWLRFVASQITQNDVDSLRAQKGDVDCSLGRIQLLTSSAAIVDVQVANFFSMDSLGKVSLVKKEMTFGIPATLHDGIWRVSLRNILQPKKEEH